MTSSGSLVWVLCRSAGSGALVAGLATGGGAALALEPAAVIPALGAGLLLTAVLANPLLSVGLVVLLSAFSPSFLADRSVTTFGAAANDWIVFLLVLGAFLRCALSGQIPIRPAVVGPLAIGALLTLPPLAGVPDESAGLKLVVQGLVPFLVFLVVRYGAFERTEGELAEIGARLLAAAVGLSIVLTVVAVAVGRPVLSAAEGGSERFTGSLGSGSYAFFLLTPAAVALAAVTTRRTTGRLVLLAALGTGVLTTLTRGALIAVAAAVAWAGVAHRRLKGALVACAVLAAVLFALFQLAPAAISRFVPTSSVPEESVRGTWLGREVVWEYAWEEFVVPSPWLGSGLGATAAIFDERTDLRTGAGAMHNDYLWILAETGAVGLSIYLLALGAVARAVWCSRHRQRHAPEALEIVQRSAALALVAFVVVSIADNAIGNFAHFGVLVFGLAGLAARSAWAHDDSVGRVP